MENLLNIEKSLRSKSSLVLRHELKTLEYELYTNNYAMFKAYLNSSANNTISQKIAYLMTFK